MIWKTAAERIAIATNVQSLERVIQHSEMDSKDGAETRVMGW